MESDSEDTCFEQQEHAIEQQNWAKIRQNRVKVT